MADEKFLAGLVWPARLSDVGPTSRARLRQADPCRFLEQSRREAAEATSLGRAAHPANGGVIAEAARLTSSGPLLGEDRLDVLVVALAPTYGLDAAGLVPADPVLRFIRDHARQVAAHLDELGVTMNRKATQ